MNKKILILSVAVLVLISASGLYFGRILKMRQDTKSQSQLTPTPKPIELATWKDQSEFEFQYPKDLNLNPHEEDTENYAHIELTSATFPGSITLWTKDTKYASVDDYIKGEKIESFIGSTLGDLPAVKILDPANGSKYSLLAIRNGYLYQIEVNDAGKNPPTGGWNEIFNSIIDSYKFSEGTAMEKPKKNAVQVPAASDETYSEEEIIE